MTIGASPSPASHSSGHADAYSGVRALTRGLLRGLANIFSLESGTDGHLLGYTKSSVDPTYLADTKEAFSKMQIVVDVLCIACYGFVKLSALAFFYRIFIREIFQYICIALAVIVGLWMIAFSFLAGFQCGSHFSALWIAADYAKYCVYSRPFLLSLTISDPILDFFVLALPIVPVRSRPSLNLHLHS